MYHDEKGVHNISALFYPKRARELINVARNWWTADSCIPIFNLYTVEQDCRYKYLYAGPASRYFLLALFALHQAI